MQSETERGQVNTFAFVVMPDHFHWLLQLMNGGSLSRTLHNVKAGSTRGINRFLGRHGSIWQKGFYDRALRSDDDLKSVARYIVANPVRAGIVKRYGDYPLWDAKWL
jgi:REP-associated tyrosine transposase